jgi:hypothetical protein
MATVLPSWNDRAVKSATVNFVARVTKEGGTDYVPPGDRIATFDNDGAKAIFTAGAPAGKNTRPPAWASPRSWVPGR